MSGWEMAWRRQLSWSSVLNEDGITGEGTGVVTYEFFVGPALFAACVCVVVRHVDG